MATITEDYCSYEVAKLLKEKGFDVPCLAHWYIGKETHFSISREPQNWNVIKIDLDWLSCPTQAMAMKWLREVHHVACCICPSIEQGFHTNKWNSYIDKLSDNFPKDSLWFVETSDSYEQACEAACSYALKNLI